MPITDSFMASCRAAIDDLPELTTFRAALAALAGATRAARPALYQAAYGDNQAGLSPAYRLRKAIRDTVGATADATVSPGERETAYATLAAEFAPAYAPPTPADQEQAELERLILEDQLS